MGFPPDVDPNAIFGKVEQGSEGCTYLEKKTSFLCSSFQTNFFQEIFFQENGKSHISKKPEFVLLQSNECHILKVLYGQFKGNHVEMYNDWESLF